jgi:hypothetical protein
MQANTVFRPRPNIGAYDTLTSACVPISNGTLFHVRAEITKDPNVRGRQENATMSYCFQAQKDHSMLISHVGPFTAHSGEWARFRVEFPPSLFERVVDEKGKRSNIRLRDG